MSSRTTNRFVRMYMPRFIDDILPHYFFFLHNHRLPCLRNRK
jgi:hypothetical protein